MTIERIDSARLAVVSAISRLDTAHIRNQITEVVNVPVTAGTSTTHDVSATFQIDAPATLDSDAELSGTIQLTGEGTISNVTVTLDKLERRVPVSFVRAELDADRNYSRVVSFEWHDQSLTFAGMTSAATVTESGGVASVVVDVRANVTTAGALRVRYSNYGAVSMPLLTLHGWAEITASAAQQGGEDAPLIGGSVFGATSPIARVFGLRATVTVSYTLTTMSSGGDVTVTVVNDESVTDWGPRPLPFPDWLLYTDVAEAEAALQPIVDRLGKPRRLHTITLAIPQTNDQNNAATNIEPGDYRHLTIKDRRLPTNINAICMALACELTINARQQGALTVVFIESGARAYSAGYDAGYG